MHKIIKLVGIAFFLLLGAHGLYVYFTTDALKFLTVPDKLFYLVEMPRYLKDWVLWMTYHSAKEWFVPAMSVAIGILSIKW